MPYHNSLKHYFVTGTDTDVGKSVVSALLLQAMKNAGKEPFYLKPLQTGCRGPYDPESDAAVIAARLGNNIVIDPAESTLYCLPQPKAPWLAGINANQNIEPDQLFDRINTVRNKKSALVIEGAGGLMVPITADFLMLDLMARLAMPVVLVARDNLGTINHTLLSIAALIDRNIPIQGVLLTASAQNPTSPEMVEENKMAIEHFGGV
ncbi:MAG: dethiobiotin synthase, partial [Desulfobacteraceae bacterium]